MKAMAKSPGRVIILFMTVGKLREQIVHGSRAGWFSHGATKCLTKTV